MTLKKNLVIFMGPPGSGKGSLSQLCIEELGWQQLSTGYLCRKHISERTEIGKQIDFSIKSGKLISDGLIIDMVKQWLLSAEQQKKDLILDGFPRNVAQAEALCDTVFNNLSFFSITIIKLHVSDDVVLQRLLSRFVCENKDCQAVYSSSATGFSPKISGICDHCSHRLVKRSDDEAETIESRLETYRVHEQGLLSFYEKKGLSINEINVERPLSMVFQQFKNTLAGPTL